MNYNSLPPHVLVKLLALDEAVAALKAGADAVERGIEDRRGRLYGNARRADDNPRALQAELERLPGRPEGDATAGAGRAVGFVRVQGLAG